MPSSPNPTHRRPGLRRTASTVVSLLVTSGVMMATLPAADAAPQPQERWIVRYEANSTQRRVQASSLGAARKTRHQFKGIFPGAAMTLTKAEAKQLRHMPGVASVVPDRRIRAAGVQRNPPTGLDRIDQAHTARTGSYTSTRTGKGVKIYVVDSGINHAHADFTDRISDGPNLVDPGLAPADCAGHGTHVAGIAAGTKHGAAKGATIVPIKVLDCQGGGYESDTLAAIDWAIKDHEAGKPAVLNLSLAGDVTPEMTAAVTSALADGITVVAAAGNAEPGEAPRSACLSGPANVPGVLTVASVAADDSQAATSNFGPCVDLFAPGTQIESAWLGTATATSTGSGTSMAAPFVSGAAALVLQGRPHWNGTQVSWQLRRQATVYAVKDLTPTTPNRMLHTLGPVTPGMIERAPRPTLSANPTVGTRVTSRAGTWGNGKVDLRHTWYRIDASGRRTAIPGATGASYVPTADDRGMRLQIVVKGSKSRYATRAMGSTHSAPVV